MNIIGVIPARGGSKGVPRKNIKELAGKPLIQYTIDEAKKSNNLKRVIVSTEDEEIAQISRDLGAEVIMRPEELASNTAPTLPVIQHIVETLEKEGEKIDATMLLQPTTPFRTAEDIDKSVEMFKEKKPDSLVSVDSVPGHFSPLWQISLNEDNEIQLFMNKYDPEIKDFKTRRQLLPKTYYRNGAIYITDRNVLMTTGGHGEAGLYGKHCVAFIMDKENFVNIDTEHDFRIAELLLENQEKSLS